MKNPNFIPIGNAFGFFIFIRDIFCRSLRIHDFIIIRFSFIRKHKLILYIELLGTGNPSNRFRET